jgi:hypothetical protein
MYQGWYSKFAFHFQFSRVIMIKQSFELVLLSIFLTVFIISFISPSYGFEQSFVCTSGWGGAKTQDEFDIGTTDCGAEQKLSCPKKVFDQEGEKGIPYVYCKPKSATDQDKITKERSKFKKCCENKKFGFNHLIHVDMKKKMPKMD